MPEFALLFRPRPTPYSADEQARLREASVAWATAATGRGQLDHPHLFDRGGVAIAADRSTAPAPTDGALGSILIVHAADLDAAVTLAKSHPGLDLGASVEVRPLRPTTPVR